MTAGSFIGQKIIVNEFVAYMNFGAYLRPDDVVAAAKACRCCRPTPRRSSPSPLCGFANLSSVAILLGGLGSMAPNRRHDIARFGLKAVAAGTLST